MYYYQENLEGFLSESERLKIIEYQINSLKLRPEESELIFENEIKITRHDGLVNQLKKYELIRNVFPLHNKESLKRLEHAWYKNFKTYSFFKSIPIDQIRDYFGESIAIYFRFFEFYTKTLYPFAIVGKLTTDIFLKKSQ